jgi:hypothetical protein
MLLGSTKLLTEISTSNFSAAGGGVGVKAASAENITTTVLKSGVLKLLEHSGRITATNEITLSFRK